MIDLYSVKPVDAETLRAAAEATGGRVVTSRTTGPRAGSARPCSRRSPTGRAARDVVKLAVARDARLGQAAELLAAAGIDAEHIADAARALVGAPVATR